MAETFAEEQTWVIFRNSGRAEKNRAAIVSFVFLNSNVFVNPDLTPAWEFISHVLYFCKKCFVTWMKILKMNGKMRVSRHCCSCASRLLDEAPALWKKQADVLLHRVWVFLAFALRTLKTKTLPLFISHRKWFKPFIGHQQCFTRGLLALLSHFDSLSKFACSPCACVRSQTSSHSPKTCVLGLLIALTDCRLVLWLTNDLDRCSTSHPVTAETLWPCTHRWNWWKQIIWAKCFLKILIIWAFFCFVCFVCFYFEKL